MKPLNDDKMFARKTNFLDKLLLTGAGLTSVVSIMGVWVALGRLMGTGWTSNDAGMVMLSAGMLFNGLTTGAGLFFRKQNRPADKKIILTAALWWWGMAFVSMGAFGLLNPGEYSALTNAGYALAMCFTPGGLLAVAGLVRFWRAEWYQIARNERASENFAEIENPLQERLVRAREYRRNIERLLKSANVVGFHKNRQTAIIQKLHNWQTQLSNLVQRYEQLENNSLLQQDIDAVPDKIADLSDQLQTEANPDMREQIQETLDELQRQKTHLDRLVAQKQRILLDIDESLATVGILYSQLETLSVQKTTDGARTVRLMDDLNQEADRLNDLLAAMDDEYSENRLN